MLEFTAFNKFSNIIYRYPVRVKTDCQTLCDVLMNDKLSVTHARWRDSMLAHNIIDVQHVPGVMNIADGLSCQYENTLRSDRDGSNWTISPYWEEKAGLVLNINQITVEPDIAELLEQFMDVPIFKGVVEAIHGIKSDLSLHEHKRAHRWAANYMIENGKLWYIGGGTPTRAITCRECVTQKEALELAWQEHETGRLFHRDLIKMTLLDRIHSPKLDWSIMTAISDCAKCKNFRSTHLNALLQPITR